MKKTYIFLFLSIIFWSCNQPNISDQSNNQSDTLNGKLIIFHAGSLAIPVKELVDSFKTLHPGVEILTEAAGSIESARKISELGKPCDIFLSADYKVIDKLLIPDYALWNIPFATNEMVIAYRPEARKSAEMDSVSWTKILLSKDVVYGRSDPDADPCGYRSLLCMQLAENYYKINGFYEKLKKKDNQFIRPKEVDLLAILESGNIDYIFIYRSVAIQHDLKYITLPAQINLGNKEFSDYYEKANISVKGKRPGEAVIQTGEAMVYGFTIPINAPDKMLAEIFAKYLLENGLKIMQKNGQPPVINPEIATYKALPEILKPFAKAKN